MQQILVLNEISKGQCCGDEVEVACCFSGSSRERINKQVLVRSSRLGYFYLLGRLGGSEIFFLQYL